jgi:hypothetical protein
MKRLVLALAITGALIVPASAQAEQVTLPPELASTGYTADAMLAPAAMPEWLRDCARGRAKVLRFALRRSGDPLLKESLKLAVCHNGRTVYWSNTIVSRWWERPYGSWAPIGEIVKSGGACCAGHGRYTHANFQWKRKGYSLPDTYYESNLHIKAHMRDGGVWFEKWSNFR